MAQRYARNTPKEVGAKFDETVAQASVGVEAVEKEIPNIREILSQNGLGNRVEVIKLFTNRQYGHEDNNLIVVESEVQTFRGRTSKMLYPSMSK